VLIQSLNGASGGTVEAEWVTVMLGCTSAVQVRHFTNRERR
jgi:hypothetical protein